MNDGMSGKCFGERLGYDSRMTFATNISSLSLIRLIRKSIKGIANTTVSPIANTYVSLWAPVCPTRSRMEWQKESRIVFVINGIVLWRLACPWHTRRPALPIEHWINPKIRGVKPVLLDICITSLSLSLSLSVLYLVYRCLRLLWRSFCASIQKSFLNHRFASKCHTIGQPIHAFIHTFIYINTANTAQHLKRQTVCSKKFAKLFVLYRKSRINYFFSRISFNKYLSNKLPVHSPSGFVWQLNWDKKGISYSSDT